MHSFNRVRVLVATVRLLFFDWLGSRALVVKPLCKASLRLCTKTILSWTLQSGVPKAPGMPLGYNNIALTFVVHSLIIGFVVNGLHYLISSHGTLDSIFWNPFGWYDFWSAHLWICITIMMFCNFKNVSKWKQNCIIV